MLWHGIFATGGAKVTINTWMSAQIDMFRDYGLGNFRELLVQLSRDPAMIYWLDNQTNHADAPNENYGRELLELFSMGVGNYTEDDVKQCARAFTGWTINQMLPRYPYGFYETKFVYRPDDHDESVKEFLGEQGAFDGEDVIDVIVRNPGHGQFHSTQALQLLRFRHAGRGGAGGACTGLLRLRLRNPRRAAPPVPRRLVQGGALQEGPGARQRRWRPPSSWPACSARRASTA